VTERELFEQWVSSNHPELDLDWNENKHTYYGITLHLMFQAWLQASSNSYQPPTRNRRKQKPFSPAVKERIAARNKQRKEERWSPHLETIRAGILAGATLREISERTPFKHNALRHFILQHEELSKLYTGN